MALAPFVETFRRMFGASEEKASGLSSPDAWLFDAFGASPAASGISVSPSTAMTCAPVRCAVQSIAEAIGQLPVHVYERSDDGSKARAPQHPAYELLHDQANDWTPASDLREQITRDALLNGNGYAFINRVEGRPVELIRLAPGSVSVEADLATAEPVYRAAEGRELRRTIDRRNILHLRAPSLDGITGASPVTQAREAIGLALIMERHAARLFGNGARPSGLITFPNALTAEAAGKAKIAWQAAHGGSNSGGTAVLDNAASWESLALNSVDAQFLELRAFAVAEIARVFRVPPVLLQDYGRATWSNSAEMGRQFLTYTLAPWLKRWEGEIRLKLFSPDERETFFAEFLVDDLLRADTSARAAAYAQFRSAGILTANECRAMENRPPLPGGDVLENPFTTTGAADA